MSDEKTAPVTDKFIDQIMKILAKAEGTDNPDEAETFFAAATRLMEKHSINDAMLQAAGKAQQDEIGFITIEFGSTYWAAWKSSSAAIGFAFGFKCLVMQNSKNGSMRWFGWKRDLANAELIWASLLIQAERASRNFLESYQSPSYLSTSEKREDRFKAKRSFITGFGTQVARRIEEQRKLTKNEAVESDGSGDLLPVLVSREKQLDDYFDEIPTQALRRTRLSHNSRGYGAGMDAGDRADIGNKRVSGQKALRG